MTSVFQRENLEFTITIGATVETSTTIDTRGFGGGSFHLPATSGTTQVTIYAQNGQEDFGIANGDDWQPLPAKAVAAGLPYPLPREAYNYTRIKLVASGGAATEDVPAILKA